MKETIRKLKEVITPYLGEGIKFGSIYFFLSLINLRAKLLLTPSWLDGRLEFNHAMLLGYTYTNNEQSRLLQFYIPEVFHRIFGLTIVNAYILQRWIFIFLAFLVFHFYLRKWFDARLAFAGVAFLAAIMPLTYIDDLQESAPLLLLSFVMALWAIREHWTVWYMLILLVGGVNNESMLILPTVYFFYNFTSFKLKSLARLILATLGTSLPAFLVVGIIRYINRNRPHLGGAWHWPDNITGLWNQLGTFPLNYWKAQYLFIFFIFGAFWLFAFLQYSRKPLFLRRAALMVPLFILANMLTGIILEVRQMLPLSFIIVPLALFYLFPDTSPNEINVT